MSDKESMKQAAVELLRECSKLSKYIIKERLDETNPAFLEFVETLAKYKKSLKD